MRSPGESVRAPSGRGHDQALQRHSTKVGRVKALLMAVFFALAINWMPGLSLRMFHCVQILKKFSNASRFLRCLFIKFVV